MSIDPKKFGLSDSLVNAVNEALKGNQHKIDANKNGKIDAQDFKKLRGEGAKPDFLDLDKDGNKTEPMKKAANEQTAGEKEKQNYNHGMMKPHAKNEEVENVDEVSSAMLYRAKQAAQKKASWLMPGDKGKGDKAWNRVKKFRDAGVAKEKQERSIKKEEVVDEAQTKQQRAARAALATQGGAYDGGKKGGAINRMALMKPKDLKKLTKKEDVDEAAVAGSNVAADMVARKIEIRRRIAAKQASFQQAKANKRISSSTIREAKCSCGEAKESKMTCEMHGDKKTLKGGKEPILMNPPLKETYSKTKY